MNLLAKDEIWLCYSCAYEESNKNEVQSKSDQANASEPIPDSKPISDPFPSLAEPLASTITNESVKPKKGSSSQPSGKKKTCPVCHKKMDWYEMEKTWRCSFCDYERSI
jgi:ribosomal protein L37AE/L43A